MKITRLVCDACGAAISAPQDKSLLRCPTWGSQTLVETASSPGQDELTATIYQVLISPPGSKFGRLTQVSQQQVVADVITCLQDNR